MQVIRRRGRGSVRFYTGFVPVDAAVFVRGKALDELFCTETM
jgi:hypothetical protein